MGFSSDGIKIPEHLKDLETLLNNIRYSSPMVNSDSHIKVLKSLLEIALSTDKKEETIKSVLAYIESQRTELKYKNELIEKAAGTLDSVLYKMAHWTVRSEESQADKIKK